MKHTEIIIVCKKDKCKNEPFEAKVDYKTYLFCCQKGFEKSLKDFQKSIKDKP